MDETPGEKVEDIEFMHDPPITERGKVQCRQAGSAIAGWIKKERYEGSKT